MKVDFTGETYNDKEIIPAGLYTVKVENVEVLTGKTSGNKYFKWSLAIVSGDCSGKKLEARTTTLKGKRWLLKQALTCCGVKVDGEIFDFQLTDLIGKEFTVKVGVKQEEWTGQDGKARVNEKNEVKQFLTKTEPIEQGKLFPEDDEPAPF